MMFDRVSNGRSRSTQGIGQVIEGYDERRNARDALGHQAKNDRVDELFKSNTTRSSRLPRSVWPYRLCDRSLDGRNPA